MIPAFCVIGGFNPNSITGLQLWLDAADASTITIATGVSQWNDKSGAGLCANVAQATGAAQPAYNTNTLNGHATLGFNGTSQFLKNTSGTLLRNLAGWTLFGVYKQTSFTAATIAIACQVDATGAGVTRASMDWNRITDGVPGIAGRRADADAIASVQATGSFGTGYGVFTGTGSYTNTTAIIYEGTTLNNTNASWLTSGSSANDNGGVGIGAGTAGAAPLTGSIAEILIYGALLSSSQLLQVQNYLKAKWKL